MDKQFGFEKVFNLKDAGSVELDTTLTKAGKAADAKAVGDRLAAIGNGGGGGTSIGTYSAGLEYTLKDNGEYEVSGIGTCTDTHLVIPSIINSVRVTSIGANAFENCHQLVSVTIPEGVTEICKEAFALCGNITNLSLSNSVAVIGESAFQTCDKLERLTIPEGVTTIKKRAFCYCYNLASVTIPKSVTTIEEYAFIYSYRNNLTFYCEAESKPSGWDENWDYVDENTFTVVWGAALDFASVNAKLATGGASIELDTTLTQEKKAADAKAVGDKFKKYATMSYVDNAVANAGGGGGNTSAGNCLDTEIYVVVNLGVMKQRYTASEIASVGVGGEVRIIKHYVATPPTTITPQTPDPSGVTPIDLYIVESTGIVYLDMGYGVMTLGTAIGQMFQVSIQDNGWSNDVGEESGVYTVRSVGSYDGGTEIIHIIWSSQNGNVSLSADQWQKIQNKFYKTVLRVNLSGTGWDVILYPSFSDGTNYTYTSAIFMPGSTPQIYSGWARDGGFALNTDTLVVQ